MGFDLYRMLRAGIPPEWSQGERLVALIIADACNDRTRQGYISNRQLCEETGYTPRSLSDVLLKLSRRGYEMRVEHGMGKDGRPVYATRGHGTDYCVPILKPRPSPALCTPDKAPVLTGPLQKAPVSTSKAPVSTSESPGPDRAPTPVTPDNPNKHLASVVTPSVEVRELAAVNGAATRQPIEQQTWLALHPRM